MEKLIKGVLKLLTDSVDPWEISRKSGFILPVAAELSSL